MDCQESTASTWQNPPFEDEQPTQRKHEAEDDNLTPGLDYHSRLSVFSVREDQKQQRAKRPDRKFACPFAKADPKQWGHIESCGTWSNRHIGTVLRHHVLQKHRELNVRFESKDPRRLDPSIFSKLQKWKQSVRLTHRNGEMLWLTTYMILFGIDESENPVLPSPYFSNKLSKTISEVIDLDQVCQSKSSNVHAACQVYRKIEIRKSRKELQKVYIRAHYDRELRNLEAKRDLELRRVEEQCIEDLEKIDQLPTVEYDLAQLPMMDTDTSSGRTTPSQGTIVSTNDLLTPSSWRDCDSPLMQRMVSESNVDNRSGELTTFHVDSSLRLDTQNCCSTTKEEETCYVSCFDGPWVSCADSLDTPWFIPVPPEPCMTTTPFDDFDYGDLAWPV